MDGDLCIQDPLAILGARKGLVCVPVPVGDKWDIKVYDVEEWLKGENPQPRFGAEGPDYYGTELKLRTYLVEMKDKETVK